MPLPSPILDDRSYQQLRDELIRRIPVYAPEWTDHNASDPGIALIELFAFLGENLLFRFNQIPDATKLAFLNTLQIPLRPAVPARAMVTFKSKGVPGPVPVPLGSELRAGAIPFEAVTEVSVWPIEITTMGKIVAAAPTSPDAIEFTQASIDARGGIQSGEQAAYYTSDTLPADPSATGAKPLDFSAAALPVDFGKSVDGAVWVALRRTADTDLTVMGGHVINLGFVPDPVVPSIDQIAPCPGVRPSATGVEMIWDASTGVLDAGGRPTYTSLTVVADTTSGLSTQGTLRLQLPVSMASLGVFSLSDADRAGTDAFPPQIPDAQLAASVVCWLRGTRRDPSRPLGKILFVGVNATDVVQMIKAPPEFVGTGTAQASQSYGLVHGPIIAGTTRIQVEETAGDWADWQAVDGFEESREDSHHYMLDPGAATITFGNGIRGQAPQIGQRIRALEYRYGGGPDGNVGAKAITKVVGVGNASVSNPLPAVGGAPAETIAEGLERVPGEFRRHDRAVTESDFKELALVTPGAGVGRADCLALFDPRTKILDAAGVVSVVVWPREDAAHPNAPLPDRNLLRQVCQWLDQRRLITTELNVIPPTYKRIAVAVGLQAKPGYGIEAVRRWVELVIRQYLAPLPPYGPDGSGWPLGRAVYGPELEAAALQVEGVQFIECLRLAAWNQATKAWVEASVVPSADAAGACSPRENIALQPWEVPELAEITVVQGPALAPGQALGPLPPPLVPIPIPTIKSEC